MTSLATGAVQYFHDLDHEREDAAAAQLAKSQGLPVDEHPQHDENHCPICAQLHMPMLPASWLMILVCMGLWVAFVTELPQTLVSQRIPDHICCRGPPVA